MRFPFHLPLAAALVLLPGSKAGAEKEKNHPACVATDDFFLEEVWTKVASHSCLKCHRAGGDAEESEFILRNPKKSPSPAEALAHNRTAFARMAREEKDGQPVMLLKVIGKLDHGGEAVLKPDSTRFRILEEYIAHITGTPRKTDPSPAAPNLTPFFEGLTMIEDHQLLRRLTLSLAARLPTPGEESMVAGDGFHAIATVLEQLMTEEAFYDRLAEGFNDIFLTPGIDDNAETVLSYEHFDKSRLWYQKWDFSHIADEKERQRAGWALADLYRDSIEREPMELLKYIVRKERPFTEIITADYIMVSPYSSRGYGIFEDVAARFTDLEDAFEYIPVKIKALTGRSERTNQLSESGDYPHAGILSTFQYLRRYPTTETNRNRLRVRKYFEQFLGIDIMQLAPRVNDAAAITAKYETPTMQAADCVVCHKIVDPVAGVFQDYYALDGKGVYGPRKDGWYSDMFKPGHEGDPLPDQERWRSLQWLGERTAKDPRFAVAMVEHAWYILSGRKALRPPEDLDNPLYPAVQRAYREQRKEFEKIARHFTAEKFNFKTALKELALSRFYRANGIATATKDPARAAELDDLGLVRLLSPEQLERKLAAVFGKDWGRLHKQFKILYGGIDSKEVTERIANPGGAMGAIQRMMANEIACKNVALDFSKRPADRRLFPNIEPDVLPAADAPKAEKQIRAAVVHLHAHILGRQDALDHPEVERTYQLFAGIIADAQSRERLEKTEIYSCTAQRDIRVQDPHYTVRAWRGVVTYLLRQHEFLYE